MAGDHALIDIIHTSPAKGFLAERKPARLNDVNPDIEAGGHTNDSSGIGRYVRLIERNLHGFT